MDWIKRNVLFVAGSVVALLLMGLAGWYLWSGMSKNDEALVKLNESYAKLNELNKQKPHPGDEKTDNVKAAKEAQAIALGFISRANSKVFQQIPAIPAGGNLDSSALAGSLRQTVDQMRKDASSRGVQVVTNCHFSFTAVKDRIMFDKAGVGPLAIQLGEVKAVCDILFAARVNAIDGIRREKVSVHDTESQQTTDYLDKTTITNDIAMLSPYEISVRCFSPEIAGMLAGFANSPYGFIVRSINVEPAVLNATGLGAGAFGGELQGMPSNPYFPGGRRFGDEMIPGQPQPFAPVAGAAPVGKGGLQTLLDEKQLKVTMLVEVVKPIDTNPTAKQ